MEVLETGGLAPLRATDPPIERETHGPATASRQRSPESVHLSASQLRDEKGGLVVGQSVWVSGLRSSTELNGMEAQKRHVERLVERLKRS